MTVDLRSQVRDYTEFFMSSIDAVEIGEIPGLTTEMDGTIREDREGRGAMKTLTPTKERKLRPRQPRYSPRPILAFVVGLIVILVVTGGVALWVSGGDSDVAPAPTPTTVVPAPTTSTTVPAESISPPTVAVPAVDLERTQLGFYADYGEDSEFGGPTSGLFVLSMAEGASVTRLLEDQDAEAIAWSPDGTKIAFHSRAAGTTDIYIANADGTDVTRLTGEPEREAWPSWSPDGTKLVFERILGPDRRDLFVIDADGADEERLTDRMGQDSAASFSPDGGYIVFTSDRDGNPGDCDDFQSTDECNFEIYLMGSDGTNVTRLTVNDAIEGFPRFSPDGSQILFHSDREGNWEVYLMEADGSDQTNLTNRGGLDGHACFSPDGTKIAFVSSWDGLGQTAIYQMNSDGSNIELIPGTIGANYPAWSPAI